MGEKLKYKEFMFESQLVTFVNDEVVMVEAITYNGTSIGGSFILFYRDM